MFTWFRQGNMAGMPFCLNTPVAMLQSLRHNAPLMVAMPHFDGPTLMFAKCNVFEYKTELFVLLLMIILVFFL